MAYELYRVNKNNSFAQTELIENVVKLKWQDDITNVFISFEFETTEILECGDWIELFETDNSETVFYGLITKVRFYRRTLLFLCNTPFSAVYK